MVEALCYRFCLDLGRDFSREMAGGEQRLYPASVAIPLNADVWNSRFRACRS